MGLQGAAALLTDGGVVRVGEIQVDGLAAIWPRDGRGLPASHLRQMDFKELPQPLMAALADADVLAAIRIVSPRRHWGYAFVTTDLRGASLRDDDDEAVGAMADQLALVLDAADLLVRTVGVERSLAHAEKLAAIGELAARMAHEIRNPVTAARSLAQQLAREPTSPLNAEHADLIVEELERVERQVRDLLRYAQREELRLEPIDLGGLVTVVAGDLAAKAEQAGVTLELDTAPGIVAPADRDRLRQVMINLIENAIEALANHERPRRLALTVGCENGSARLRVADNGPGIPTAALARLFEPFFSLKPNGTGLGLAIAKRTIDAHGGTIVAESREGEGACFDVVLPLEGRRA
jgi:signal transduction histidine kinase